MKKEVQQSVSVEDGACVGEIRVDSFVAWDEVFVSRKEAFARAESLRSIRIGPVSGSLA